MKEKVLIIDDEKSILEGLSRVLEREGFTTIRAESGRQGLDLLKTETVGLIVTDIRLPDISGLEVLKQAKELDPRIEVIILSGFVTDDNRKMALLNGAFSFLAKPLDSLEHLYTNIRGALRKRKNNIAHLVRALNGSQQVR